MNLKDSQNKFVNSITTNQFDSDLLEGIKQLHTLTPEKALEVYRNDYTARLTSSLGENFESLWWVLGDEEFFKLAGEYIEKHPSELPDLGQYGNKMVSFLENHSTLEDYPFLAELAQLEWDFLEIFHQQPVTGLTSEDFNQLPSLFESRFELSPHLRLQSSEFPIYSIWKNARENGEAENIEWNEERWLLYKHNHLVLLHSLSPMQFEIVSHLQLGQCLQDAIDNAASKVTDFTEDDISSLFSLFSRHGLITHVSS